MAALSDIERALVAQLAAVLFPAGGYRDGAAVASAAVLANAPSGASPGNGAGVTLKLYRGWPVADKLDADLLAGRAHVSVFPEAGMSRNTTRYRAEWFSPIASAPTLTATVSGAAVTFGGTGGAGQVAAVSFGYPAEMMGYSYRLLSTDTPITVAAALAGQVAGTSTAGAVLTLPTNTTVTARVVADTNALREVRRQEQGVRVSIWAPTPWARDAVAGLVDQTFAGMVNVNGETTEFLTLANGETARVRYRSTFTDDKPSKDHEWRLDMCFTIEYATTVAQAQPLMLLGGIGLAVARGPDDVAALTNIGVTNPLGHVWTDEDGNVMTDALGNLAGKP